VLVEHEVEVMKTVVSEDGNVLQEEEEEATSEQVIEKQKEKRVREKEWLDPLKAPFIVQAPNSEWSNPLFENGCEEASLLMVARLVQSKGSLTPEEAKKELLKISAYEQKIFGHAFDTSATDTNRILREYFAIEGKVAELATENELRSLVAEKNIIIVPTNGQLLKNPFFKAPGPVTHMLVILAFESESGEYIVHDPGTKRGEQYRYQAKALFGAIEDYPTGATHLVDNQKEKRVIAVSLEKNQENP
jgi:hypothetical protein